MGVALSNQKSLWRRAARQIADAVLPQSCLLCGTRSGAHTLCPACIASLPRLDSLHCPICASPSPGGQTCGDCLKNPPHFDATQAHYRYAFPLDQLLQNYKYAQQLAISRLFDEARPTVSRIDAVIAVPSSPAHLRQRGFNPALELAKPYARRMDLPLLLDTCQRPHDAPAQASLPWKARQANIKNAFTCHADLSGMRILVIDDIMTTGATLNELARILKRHGAAYVENRVVARAVKDWD